MGRVRKGWVWVAVAVTVVGGSTGAYAYLKDRAAKQRAADRAAATQVATDFLRAWEQRRYADLNALTAGVDDPAATYQQMDVRLGTTEVVTVPGPLNAAGDALPFSATVTLGRLGDISFASEVEVTKAMSGWRVVFRSRTVHPDVRNGQRLELRSTPGGRGAVLDRKGRRLSASADLAANVVGQRGTGLQRVLEERLQGTDGSRLVVRDVGTGKDVVTVQEFAPKPAEGVRTTLDLDVQRVAEASLSGVSSRSTVVVVHAPTGQIRAIANRPVAGVPAHSSSYAPGSVFKVVTATALLQRGVRPTTQVACPARTSSGGRSFRNDDEKDLGTVSFAQAFAQSCNTSFLELAEDLPPQALRDAAALYGFGERALLPVAVDPSLVPDTDVPAERAAAAIGQGRVEASPLVIASMAAAVATGTWRQPLLVPGEQDVRRLPSGVAAALRPMMRSVVTTGTGRAAQGAGGPVSGKTGTAQYGDGSVAHAWFTGFRGDLAFCVFVETGVSGGTTAAPVARRLLAAL